MPMSQAEPAFTGPLARAFGEVDLATLLADPNEALPVPLGPWPEGTADEATVADVASRALAELGTPWPQPLASAAARYHGDGDRVSWETPAFARQERLSRAVLLAAATPPGEEADRWLDEVVDGAWLLCEQSSWCWPAHDDTRTRHGSVLATVTDPYLDLGAGEVVGQLAWLDHVLGDRLDSRYPGVRERLRHEARVRVFDPFARRRDWHWIGLDGRVHNWNPWIHGNVLVAALRLLDGPDDREERARIVALCIEGLDRYVAVLPEDGAIDEGYAYWWNGACRLLEALDVLAHATGEKLDPVPEVAALRGIVAFPHRMHLGDGWYVNVSDGQALPPRTQPWHSLLRAARRAGDAEAAAHALSYRAQGAPAAHEAEGLGRLLRGATDPEWLGGSAPVVTPSAEEGSVFLPSTQMLVARERDGGLTLVIKGGHNAENHNHNDVGSVIVASGAVPVVVDPGRPTYTAQTFSAARYSMWMMQSDWHSAPFIRGSGQSAGRRFAARDVEDSPDTLALELADAYDVAGLRSWRREARLDRGERRVVIRDVWDLEPWEDEDDEPDTSVRFVLAGAVELAPGRARVTPIEAAPPLILSWDPGVPAATVVKEFDDPMLTEVWGGSLIRLDLDVRGLAELVVTLTQETP
ncbi:hypothetical protein E4U02_11710 [Microbacterium paludicola]|uniref:Heparinase II/III-like C-terminal domain-containing protein n=2 Tax=Microbacterium paludicola TaxID=300019 RepID=A0A4Y9FTA8_9MICO|nr:heparinase II/III family protein [Microbacterium paludicola]TFU32214.1 hypothetical protein E4U02_11710 [Microbacterium paludicola]